MRRLLPALLLLLAVVVAPVAILAGWVDQRVTAEDEFVAAMAPLADDEEVRQILADSAADGAVEAVQQYLPVAVPAAVSDWAREAARAVVDGPGFEDFWVGAVRDLHHDGIALLEDPDADTSGALTVDAAPLLAQVLLGLEEYGLPVQLLPDVPLEVAVVQRSEVAEGGPAYRTADAVGAAAPVVWAGLVLLAVALAPGWRVRVRAAAFGLLGLALAAGLVMLGADDAAAWATEQVPDAGHRRLALLMIDAVTESLPAFARGFLLVGAAGGIALLVLSRWRAGEGGARRDAGHDAHAG